VPSVGHVGEPGGHPEALARAAYRSLEHHRHAEQRAERAHVGFAPLEREHRGARGDAEPLDLGERVDELVGHAVAEVLGVGIGTRVHERQHRNGAAIRCASGRGMARRGEPAERLLEGAAELRSRGKAVAGILRQRAGERLLQGHRDLAPERPHRRGRLHHVARHRDARRRAGEGRLSREHFVDDARQAVDVGAAVELGIGAGLLRAHVGGRADRESRLRHGVILAHHGGQGARDTEVGDDRLAIVHEDVLRLHVAVKHAVPVGIVERGGDGAPHADGIGDGEPAFALEARAQRLAAEIRHDVVQKSGRLARVVERHDLRMHQPRGDPDLAEESLRDGAAGYLGPQHLDGNLTPVLEVFGDVDRCHPAAPELAVEPVAFSEGCPKGIGNGHAGANPRRGHQT
jgi:hypothetical protein